MMPKLTKHHNLISGFHLRFASQMLILSGQPVAGQQLLMLVMAQVFCTNRDKQQSSIF